MMVVLLVQIVWSRLIYRQGLKLLALHVKFTVQCRLHAYERILESRLTDARPARKTTQSRHVVAYATPTRPKCLSNSKLSGTFNPIPSNAIKAIVLVF